MTDHDGPDDPTRIQEFDTYARQAGSSLRDAPPPGGASSAIRTAKRRVVTRTAAAVGAAGVLAIGAVALFNGDDSGTTAIADESSTTSAAPATTITTTISESTAAVPADIDDETAWALDYVGGTPGAASGAPVRIGYVWDDVNSYVPQIEAMARYVSEELGGIDGRPIEIVSCNVGTTVFGARAPGEGACASQLGGDPGVVAIIGEAVYEEFQRQLAGSKPLLLDWPGAGTTAIAYQHGALDLIEGLIRYGTSVLPAGAPRQIAFLGAASEATFVQGRGLDVDVLDVAVGPPERGDKATVEEVAAAIQGAGADDAPVVAGYALPACDVVEAAYASLGKSPIFIGPDWCPQEGWTILGDVIDPSRPQLANGEATVVSALTRFGSPLPTIKGRLVGDPTGAAELLTLTRILNQVGLDNASSDTVIAALNAYDGPVLTGSGNADCSFRPATALYPDGGCSTQLEVNRVVDGRLEPLPPLDLDF